MPKERFKQPLTASDPDFTRNLNARLDELYVQAKEADLRLGEFLTEVRRIVPGKIIHPGLKNRNTARDKLRRGAVNDDPDTLMDISRATIAYEDLAGVIAASEYIKRQPAYAKVCDRFNGPAEDSGYRDIKFFLKFPVRGGRQHYVELQLNLTTMRAAVKIGHPIYEIVRRAGKGEARQVTIPSSEVALYAGELREVFVALKQHRVIAEPDTTNLRRVVMRFFDPKNPEKPRTGAAVNVPPADILFLRSLTPKLYHSYTNKALNARVVRKGALQPVIDAHMHHVIRHPPKKSK